MVGAAQGVLDVAENCIHPSKLGALDSGSAAAHHHRLMNAARRGDPMKAGQPIGDDPSACAEIEAHLEWYAKMESYRADAMFDLIDRFDELLRVDGRVPHTVRTELRGRLDEIRTWRNALCHGAWFGFSGAGAGVLSHYYREGKRIVQFSPMVTLKDFADLRARIVDATIRVAEASSVAGSGSTIAVILPRKFEPRNREPEQK